MLREDAIEDVIRQFADPMAFLRELVQNALDAGSQEVDIQLEYEAEHQNAIVSVVDWGEGMTREIVETRLVRLFNSTKDEDLTKIGKFGIGFVSVFAMEPEVVCVDTGRDGEYWRILLHPDRSYELIPLDHAVEGTTVSLHIQMEEEAFEGFQNEAKRRVTRWCRFAAVPVLFEGEDIRQKFDLSGILVVRFEEEGTRAVAALHEQLTGSGQYFNGGLALQTVPSQWPHVSFMMDSRFLEHTLTRDQVLQNKKFHAAIERLTNLVEVELLERVADALANWGSDPDLLWDWERLCGVALVAYDESVFSKARFPTIGKALHGLKELRDARGRQRLMLTRGRSHIAGLMPDDYVLLDVRPDTNAARLLQTMLGRDVPVLEDVWVHPVVIDASGITGAKELAGEVEAALRILGSRPNWIGFAQFDYPYSGLQERGVLRTPDRRAAHHRSEFLPFRLRETNDDLLLNPAHPIVADAMRIATTEPEWAGYTVVKCAALGVEAVELGELDGDTDAALALEMLQRRAKRLGK